ncbi:MAG: hypothetical protein ACD_73C00787G0002 [uncultured bacterium]|nr:MAG: hypothetical protein ACD_73C00787G0002 [uncultured bacterium]
MKIIKYFLLVALILSSFSSFAGVKSDYKKILKKWSRHDEVYAHYDLKAAIIWDATFLSEEMLEAQADLYARQYDLDDSQKLKEWENLRSSREGKTVFFVSFFNSSKKLDDLSNPKHGWLIRLKSRGNVFEPVLIERLKRYSPEAQLFYPYILPWSVTYRVSFPPNAIVSGQKFELDVRNQLSDSHLIWDKPE